MDSLLVILAVVGVVMILAGIARMKSKKKQTWDDIDHSVLFTKNDDAVSDVKDTVMEEGVVGPARVVVGDKDDNPLSAEEEFKFLDNLLTEKDEKPSSPNVTVTVDEDDRSEHVEKAAVSKKQESVARARSFFDKLRAGEEDGEDEDEDLLDPCYREGAPDKVVVLNVMAPNGQHFAGGALRDLIEQNGLIFGAMDIYHLQRGSESMFSLINMVKPGVFDPASMEEMTTPGVSLFIQLPNNLGNCVSAYDTMLEVGNSLASQLGGELRDERRSVLTQSAIDHTREQLIEYDCKWLVH